MIIGDISKEREAQHGKTMNSFFFFWTAKSAFSLVTQHFSQDFPRFFLVTPAFFHGFTMAWRGVVAWRRARRLVEVHPAEPPGPRVDTDRRRWGVGGSLAARSRSGE